MSDEFLLFLSCAFSEFLTGLSPNLNPSVFFSNLATHQYHITFINLDQMPKTYHHTRTIILHHFTSLSPTTLCNLNYLWHVMFNAKSCVHPLYHQYSSHTITVKLASFLVTITKVLPIFFFPPQLGAFKNTSAVNTKPSDSSSILPCCYLRHFDIQLKA